MCIKFVWLVCPSRLKLICDIIKIFHFISDNSISAAILAFEQHQCRAWKLMHCNEVMNSWINYSFQISTFPFHSCHTHAYADARILASLAFFLLSKRESFLWYESYAIKKSSHSFFLLNFFSRLLYPTIVVCFADVFCICKEENRHIFFCKCKWEIHSSIYTLLLDGSSCLFRVEIPNHIHTHTFSHGWKVDANEKNILLK